MLHVYEKNIYRHRIRQWFLLSIVIVTIGLGWRYPLFGFSVPIVMTAGIIGGMVNGRFVCGNLCPRGSFFDRIISLVSKNKPLPKILFAIPLRVILLLGLFGFMFYRIGLDPRNVYHWGRTFWLMCVVTTTIGIIAGLIIRPRTWCAICPMGTIQRLLGAGKRPLHIDSEKCIDCGTCHNVCPMNIEITAHKKNGHLKEGDCIKCPECISSCPREALMW